MEIIKVHYTPGKEVKKYSEIEKDAKEMTELISGGIKRGEYNKGHALAHGQVSDDPFAFFVLSDSFFEQYEWPGQVIINPEIIKTPQFINIAEKGKSEDKRKNTMVYKEGCFSFPHRKPKRVERFFRIKVRYQIKGTLGLKSVKEWIEGIKAHVFQHEVQHIIGKNIYFEVLK
ncbi:MAG: peptide deformylase [Patescibacteria group bacterium]|nr:peptide deformylase [Patescibacteria group bacterium]